MIAITTKYMGPTNTRGSRIKAFTCNGHQITVGYDDSLSSEKAHRKAAIALSKKMKWTGTLISGGTKDGYNFCFCPALDSAIKVFERLRAGERGGAVMGEASTVLDQLKDEDFLQ